MYYIFKRKLEKGKFRYRIYHEGNSDITITADGYISFINNNYSEYQIYKKCQCLAEFLREYSEGENMNSTCGNIWFINPHNSVLCSWHVNKNKEKRNA